jgi:hypothetical protein
VPVHVAVLQTKETKTMHATKLPLQVRGDDRDLIPAGTFHA